MNFIFNSLNLFLLNKKNFRPTSKFNNYHDQFVTSDFKHLERRIIENLKEQQQENLNQQLTRMNQNLMIVFNKIDEQLADLRRRY